MQSGHSDETGEPVERPESVREVDAPRRNGLVRSRATSDRTEEDERARLDEVIEHGEPGGGPKVENV